MEPSAGVLIVASSTPSGTDGLCPNTRMNPFTIGLNNIAGLGQIGCTATILVAPTRPPPRPATDSTVHRRNTTARRSCIEEEFQESRTRRPGAATSRLHPGI